jgi:formamidopyrimidine-DNA glycosylase
VPELPDVAGYRRLVARSLHRLDHVEFVDPGELRNTDREALDDAVSHQDVQGVERRGKWLVVHVERAALVIHLGTTGSLVLAGSHDALAPGDRVVLHGDAEVRLRDRRRLGGIWLAVDAADVADITGPLGPEATTSPSRSSLPPSAADVLAYVSVVRWARHGADRRSAPSHLTTLSAARDGAAC